MVYHIYCDASRQPKDRCIILGAIGFQKNGYNLLTGTRKSKKELTKYIAEHKKSEKSGSNLQNRFKNFGRSRIESEFSRPDLRVVSISIAWELIARRTEFPS